MVILIGWVGAGLLLLAYGLLSIGKLQAQSLKYQGMNILASIMLIASAVYSQAWPFVVINSVWAVVGIAAVIRLYINKG